VDCLFPDLDRKYGTSNATPEEATAAAARDIVRSSDVEYKTCEAFENQRWFPIVGWGARLLPTDRKPWSDESGRIAILDLATQLDASLGEGWEIREGWHAKSGWQYAVDFPSVDWTPSPTKLSCVRRKNWTAALVRQSSQAYMMYKLL
jgi:hypothetical protein